MNRAAAALVALLMFPATGDAQPMPAPPPPPYQPVPGEHAGDRHEMRQDRRELRDDRRDLFWTEQLLARFDDAVARRARRALNAVENDILRTLDRELQEARIELMKSRREARRSQRELRDDAWAGDRREMRDDRRDLRDDRRDLRDDRRDLVRVKAIRSEFWSLRGRLDRRAIERKRGLVAELVHMARTEIHEDRAERREDRREMREERREGWDRAH